MKNHFVLCMVVSFIPVLILSKINAFLIDFKQNNYFFSKNFFGIPKKKILKTQTLRNFTNLGSQSQNIFWVKFEYFT